MSYIEELQEVIRKLHGVESTHRESVPVKEVFDGETVWEGIVEVFTCTATPSQSAYAWTHATDDPGTPKRSVTVLHVPPAVSPVTAVRVAIMQELKELRANAEPEAEAS